MELTPEGLRDLEFSERWRGYDPDEVDEFCDRVAQLVEMLQGRPVGDEPAGANGGAASSDAVTALQRARSDLEAEVEALARYVDEERMRVRAVLGELERRLEQTASGIAARRARLAPARIVPPPSAPDSDGRQDAADSGGQQAEEARAPEPVPESNGDAVTALAAARRPADDDFFAELRGALDDDEPLGPPTDVFDYETARDAGLPPPVSGPQPDDHPAPSRRRRRLLRRGSKKREATATPRMPEPSND
jgi:DivIVA domain-containing protein